MKGHYLHLFAYDKYANETILSAILEAGAPESAVQVMAHLLRAQQVWFNRCNGLPATTDPLWPDWRSDTFDGLINKNYDNWIGFLNTIEPEALEQVISYQTFKGDPFENKLEDILSHLINHGTHHRAQIGQQLKAAGLQNLPNTDYIAFIRHI
jgi:uncharacterized damage-inducible protein DinB